MNDTTPLTFPSACAEQAKTNWISNVPKSNTWHIFYSENCFSSLKTPYYNFKTEVKIIKLCFIVRMFAWRVKVLRKVIASRVKIGPIFSYSNKKVYGRAEKIGRVRSPEPEFVSFA